ncbi:MAG: carboxylesterase family protein [Negativicutes bacterium]|jgi:para-nitrobenzyl esterase
MNKFRPFLEAPCGKIAGFYENNQALFLGIPYAKPPVGDLRWRNPVEMPVFRDVFFADKYGGTCPQPKSTWIEIEEDTQSEDCLYLNIRASRNACGSLPVAVHIHGGGYTIGTGANEDEDGRNFVEQGMIFVTINYRLGPYGFLYLDDIDKSCQGSGCIGILDQIAALRWVKKNIAAFGGNPDEVTILGCSAGGGSVAALMVVEQAKGLFNKAIAQSGSLRLTKSVEKANAVAQTFMKYTGVANLSEMRALPHEKLFKAYSRTLKKYGFTAKETAFAPVRDNVVIPEEPFLALEHGAAKGVKFLTGTAKDEMNGFKHISRITKILSFRIFKWIVPQDVSEYFGRIDDVVADFYNRNYKFLSKPDRLFKAATAGVFLLPQLHMAIAQSKYAPVYYYRFDWGGKDGALHGSESPFVFGRYDADVKPDREYRKPPQTVVNAMHNAWAAFIKTGTPATGTTINWELFDDTNYATMLIDEKCELKHDPDKHERVFWDNLN